MDARSEPDKMSVSKPKGTITKASKKQEQMMMSSAIINALKEATEEEARRRKRDARFSPATAAVEDESATPSQSACDNDSSIITLSDGSDDEIPAKPVRPLKVSRKRRSGGELASSEEDRLPLKTRKINVLGAPKMPLTGYVRYMNERREELRRAHPRRAATEHTKLIGEEWQQLSEEGRAPYMKAAQEDKQRYAEEVSVFLRARPEMQAKQRRNTSDGKALPQAQKLLVSSAAGAHPKSGCKERVFTISVSHATTPDTAPVSPNSASTPTSPATPSSPLTSPPSVDKKDSPPPLSPILPLMFEQHDVDLHLLKRTPTPTLTNTSSTGNSSISGSASGSGSSSNATVVMTTPVPGEIPIFTAEFLEHNKVADMELRTLRKSKSDLDQQNAVLEKHVENMKFGVQKLTTENDDLQEKNRLLVIYLDKLKRKLAHALSGLSIPSEPNGATLDNITKYMNDLYKMSMSNNHGPASLNKARDIIRKLDLQIQL